MTPSDYMFFSIIGIVAICYGLLFWADHTDSKNNKDK